MNESGEGRLAKNILLFCRILRQAGLAIGPGMMLDAVRAIAVTGIRRPDDFRSALRAVLVRDPSEAIAFDQAFHLCFLDRGLLARTTSLFPTHNPARSGGSPADDTVRRLARSVGRQASASQDSDCVEMDRSATYSAAESFSTKDFDQMSEFELLDAKRMLRESASAARKVRTRRFRANPAGRKYDLRRSLQRMLRCDGELLQLARQRHGDRQQVLVLLCDISGSMGCYPRLFLQYAHALLTQSRIVQVFVFGTRLSNVTRWLRNSDVDVALQKVAAEVPDWDGGTRIADSLRAFNRDWGRRVLAANASVVLFSDGLERDSHSGLDFEMQRLKRSCRQLIWMNPMLRYDKFEAQAYGIRVMLPYVDCFVSAHSVATVTELGRLLSADRDRRVTRMSAGRS